MTQSRCDSPCISFYKGRVHKYFMDYESLLEEAYKKVKATDEHERFDMIKVKGRHDGTRTIISNFMQIVTFSRRKPEHLLKFLTKELASSGEIKGDRLILSRRLPSKNINEKIDKYVNMFILCRKCKKPDTELIKENNRVFLKCLACGEKYEVQKI